MRSLCAVILVLLAGSLSAPAWADDAKPFLRPLFTDNMVLQRGLRDSVWGWTTPGRKVTVRMGGKSADAVADSQGKWLAKLGPFRPGGPYTLSISGPQSVTLHNVLVGDVWICSGQSNMSFGIANAIHADQDIAQANYPDIRLYTVPNVIALDPQRTAGGSWAVCTPDTVKSGGWGGFTAVGYFFGRNLYEKLHIPIGLIHTSWGGTPAEAWTNEQALATLADFQPAIGALELKRAAEKSDDAAYARSLSDWYTKNDPGSAGGLGWADPALDDLSWPTMTLPGYFQQAGVAELAHINGVIWFRRTFDLPADAAGKALTLHLLVDDNDTTWVNGTQVGATEGYQTPRAYALPASLLKPTGNIIAVRVLDTGGQGGIYGTPDQLSLDVPGGQPLPMGGPWRYKLGAALTQASAPPKKNMGYDQNYPTVLYNAMINPLIRFGIKGTIWYQGESNAGRAYQYRTLLPTMIGDWRARWGEGYFPFFIVQLANFTDPPAQPGDSDWAELREAQMMTAQTVPNAGIATAIEIGDAHDIHPKNKQEVGRRLALVALAMVYGQKDEYSGPVYQSMRLDGSAIRLSFTHVDGGMMAKGDTLTGFAVAGEDQKWAWADARIDGDTVEVSSPKVPHPVAARYAWAANPVCNLYDKDGLPAFPFRTDSWPGVTAGKK